MSPKKKTPSLKKPRTTKTQKPKKTLPSELFQLEQSVGEFMHYWGFKAIHGRIWTHLFISTSALDSLELMIRLRVSKGLMSLALRDLLDYNVIVSDHVGKHGTTFYKANPEIINVISNVLRKRELQMLKKTHQSAINLKNVLSKNVKISSTQLDHILEMTQTAQLILSAFLNQNHEKPYSLLFDAESN